MSVSPPRLIIWACISALVALGLIIWSLVDPRPIPVIAAMSVGQAIGTLSFGAFLLAVLGDLRRHYRRRGASLAPPAPESDRGGP